MGRKNWRKLPLPGEGQHMEGTWLVDDSSGARVRELRGCEQRGPDGLVDCSYLNLVRILYGLGTGRNAGLEQTSQRLAIRISVVCRECSARSALSGRGYSWLIGPWFSKSLARLAVGTSISWQMEQRPDDTVTAAAFGAWPDSIIVDVRAELQRLTSGKPTADTSSKRT